MTEISFGKIQVELVQSLATDQMVAAAAKVSTRGDASMQAFMDDPSNATGLVNFLMKNRHGTPFEHNSFTFFVKAPIFVFREFHRHRVGWSYNEESGRYKQLEPVFYIPDEDRNIQQIGKAGHYEFVPGTYGQRAAITGEFPRMAREAYASYERMLERGIAKEVARMVLPVNTFSSMYATCNARSLMSFLSLRTKSDESMFKSFPQREIEMVAEKIEDEFATKMPITYAAFVKHGRVSP